MVYSILLTTKTKKVAQKCRGKEILNLSWKSAGRVGWVTVKDSNPNDSTFKFLSLVSVAYEINIFPGKCPKINSWSAKYFIEISNNVC